jgi:Tryptophan-associated transmembrane protein (Trp_oprn_chp)
VLLAAHQGWARVLTAAPKPLPAGAVTVSGQALVPAAAALALAALASLAAVLATRRTLRRVVGVVLAGFGVAIAVAVAAGISAADVRAAAAAGAGSAAAVGATGGAGSATAGGNSGASTAPVAGFAGHVVFSSFPWRGVAVAGALAVIAAGVLVAWRADRMPVMSGRYELPARTARRAAAASQSGTPAVGGAVAGRAVMGRATSGRATSGGTRDSATIWEALSRGEDPTAGGPGCHGRVGG